LNWYKLYKKSQEKQIRLPYGYWIDTSGNAHEVSTVSHADVAHEQLGIKPPSQQEKDRMKEIGDMHPSTEKALSSGNIRITIQDPPLKTITIQLDQPPNEEQIKSLNDIVELFSDARGNPFRDPDAKMYMDATYHSHGENINNLKDYNDIIYNKNNEREREESDLSDVPSDSSHGEHLEDDPEFLKHIEQIEQEMEEERLKKGT